MRPKSPTYTESELQFMKVLWEKGEATPDEIIEALADAGRDLTYGTVRNLLVLMIEKGYVARRKQGKVYLYRAVVGREEARKTMLLDMLSRVFDGSESSMVATLLSAGTVSEDKLDEIHRLLDEKKMGGTE